MNNDKILIELIQNQIKNMGNDKKLLYNDLRRISKYLQTSIFTNDCSIWTGYITHIKNNDKNLYINFYFKGKKHALHRLLYLNFIGNLADSEYIKFNCINKGKCCNIKHIHKLDKIELPKDNKQQTNDLIPKQTNKDIIVGFN